MTNFQKLKHEARRAEQRSDWARAIDLYRRALDTDEDMTDLSLFNRIGDLHHRQGQTDEAVASYEQAVERYAENGMHTSAIALCNKILRIAPDRASVFRRLAGLHAQTGLLVEGRANCMAYVRLALEEGAAGDASQAVEEFATLSGDEEIRLQYAEALEAADDVAGVRLQLGAVYAARRDRGIDDDGLRERIVALGGEVDDAPAVESTDTSESAAAAADGAIDLAARVARDLALVGDAPGFDPSPPAPGPEPRRGEDGLDAARQAVGRFREEVRQAVDGGDVGIRYDLGIEFMTIGLLDEAVEEFRSVVASPGLVEAASARIAECVALRNAGESFAPRAPYVAAAPSSEPTGVPAADPPLEASEAVATEEADKDDELQGHFFRARLAQYRIRRAEERHSTDHAGHLDLGTAYVEMDLHHEAIREFGVALSGPRPVSARAARALAHLTADPGTTPELALHAMALLAGSDHASTLSELGAALADEWGPDHELADRLAELLRGHAASTDELPSLESMFPALAEPVSPPDSEIRASAEPSRAGSDTGPESVPATEGPPPAASSASGMQAEDLAELDELLSQLDDAGLDGAQTLEFEIDEASQLAADGDPGAAADLLTSVLERLEGEHRTREAIEVMNQLIALRPDDVMLHHHRTELALMVNSRELLLSSYAQLGACLRRNDTAQNARAAYGRMLDVDPTNTEAKTAIADIDAEEVSGERRAEGHGDSTAAGERKASKRGEFDALLDDLGTGDSEDSGHILRSDETDADDDGGHVASSHHDLGLAFRQMGMWDEAARELTTALDGVTDRLSVLEALGECLVKADRGEEAVALLKDELRSDEDAEQIGPLYWLGIAQQSVGNADAARATFERIEAASPGYRDAAGRLAELSL